MKMRATIQNATVIVVLGAALFIPVSAFGAGLGEEPTLQTVPAGISIDYDYLSDTVTTRDVTVEGNNSSFGIGFSAGGSGDYNDRTLSGPGGELRYQLLDSIAEGMVVQDLDGRPDGSGLITGQVPFSWRGLTTATATFDLIVYQGALVLPGIYTDTVTLTLYSADESDPFADSAVLPVSVQVLPHIAIVMVDPGGGFESGSDMFVLDFGTLATGMEQAVDLLVVANLNYTVTVDSTNAGVMSFVSGGDGSTVPYTLRVDGTAQDLSGGSASVVNGSGPTDLSGDRHTFSFQVGEVAGATSGAYQDNLTIIVTGE